MARGFQQDGFQNLPPGFQDPNVVPAGATLGVLADEAGAAAKINTAEGTLSVTAGEVAANNATSLAAGEIAASAGILSRQYDVHPTFFASTNWFGSHHISHRGGGKGKARTASRKVEPEKKPVTFEEFLKRWRPPEVAIPPAPHLVRKSVRDTRPAPKIKPIAGDVLAVDNQIKDALDHRDAYAMLEQALQDAQRRAEEQDEQDVMEILSKL